MPSPTHSVESPLPLFSFFTLSLCKEKPSCLEKPSLQQALTHKQARSPATGLTAGLFLSRILFIDLGNTPTLDVLGRNVLSRGQALGLNHCRSAQALVRVYPPLAAYACLCAQPDIGRLTQASAPLGAMASRSMECCAAPLVLASNSPVGSRAVLTISLPEILHRRATLRLVPPPTAHDLYS